MEATVATAMSTPGACTSRGWTFVRIVDESPTDRSSVSFGFCRDAYAVDINKSHLVDHVAKLWRQLHEWERLLRFPTKDGMPRFLHRGLFGLLLRR